MSPNPEFGMSPRQRALAESLGDSGIRVNLDPPEPAKAVLSDEQVAATCARVFAWVMTGAEPPGGDADEGWHAAAHVMRTMFGGEADIPPINTDQLIDVVRGAVARANRFPPPCPLNMLSPHEYAGWRAAARHGYNCIVAERDAMRDNPLAERERVMVRGARQALGIEPADEPEPAVEMTNLPPAVERRQPPAPPPTAPPPQPAKAVTLSPFVTTLDSFS